MFGDLPDGCVAHVVGLLHSVRDVLNFTATCKRHAEIARALRAKWLQLLHTDFDTQLQVDVSINTMTPHQAILTRYQQCAKLPQGAIPFDGQEFYKSLATSKPCALRFHGCFTDGGVDEQLAMYWASEFKVLLFCALLSGLAMTC